MLDLKAVGARVFFNVSGSLFLSLCIRPRRVEWCKSVNIKVMGAMNRESLPMLTRETAAMATERRIEAHRNCSIWPARAENGLFSFTAIKAEKRWENDGVCFFLRSWLSGNLPAWWDRVGFGKTFDGTASESSVAIIITQSALSAQASGPVRLVKQLIYGK